MSGTDVLVLSSADVERLLGMGECIEAMASAFMALGRGNGVQPLRSVTRVPDGSGSLYVMPAFLPAADPNSEGTLSVKLISLFIGNTAVGLESHQGVIVLFGARQGEVRAVMEASRVTAIRTAAVSALATRLLALPDAADLAILGAGVQARSHIEAMLAVRNVRRVRIWSRTPGNARRLAEEARARHSIDVSATETAEAAVRGADLICATTASPSPVLKSEWVSLGAHINAVGSSTPGARELDTETMARACVFVDSREAALAEAGDVLIPMAEGAFGRGHIRGELGELVAGRCVGRVTGSDITVFKSLGLAVEDAAAARLLYDRAGQAGNVGATARL